MEEIKKIEQVENVTMTNTHAIIALVFGIVGLTFPFIEIVAIILATIGIKKSYKIKSGRGMSITGLVFGAVALAYKSIAYFFIFTYLLAAYL